MNSRTQICVHIKATKNYSNLPLQWEIAVKQDEMQEVFHIEVTIKFVLTKDFMNRTTTNIDPFGGPPRP